MPSNGRPVDGFTGQNGLNVHARAAAADSACRPLHPRGRCRRPIPVKSLATCRAASLPSRCASSSALAMVVTVNEPGIAPGSKSYRAMAKRDHDKDAQSAFIFLQRVNDLVEGTPKADTSINVSSKRAAPARVEHRVRMDSSQDASTRSPFACLAAVCASHGISPRVPTGRNASPSVACCCSAAQAVTTRSGREDESTGLG